MSTKTRFAGTVGGITYDDPGLFEQAARALGYKGFGRRSTRWQLGLPICVTLGDGTKVHGQVWAQADVKNYVWVALDNGKYVAVYTPTGHATASPRGEWIGRVAA